MRLGERLEVDSTWGVGLVMLTSLVSAFVATPLAQLVCGMRVSHLLSDSAGALCVSWGRARLQCTQDMQTRKGIAIGRRESCSLPALNSQHRFGVPLVPTMFVVEVRDIPRTPCS